MLDSTIAATATALGPGESEALWFFGGLTTIKSDAASTNGRVAVTEQLAPRGAGSPLHVQTARFCSSPNRTASSASSATSLRPPRAARSRRWPPDVQALTELAADYGVEIIGPPGTPA